MGKSRVDDDDDDDDDIEDFSSPEDNNAKGKSDYLLELLIWFRERITNKYRTFDKQISNSFS